MGRQSSVIRRPSSVVSRQPFVVRRPSSVASPPVVSRQWKVWRGGADVAQGMACVPSWPGRRCQRCTQKTNTTSDGAERSHDRIRAVGVSTHAGGPLGHARRAGPASPGGHRDRCWVIPAAPGAVVRVQAEPDASQTVVLSIFTTHHI